MWLFPVPQGPTIRTQTFSSIKRQEAKSVIRLRLMFGLKLKLNSSRVYSGYGSWPGGGPRQPLLTPASDFVGDDGGQEIHVGELSFNGLAVTGFQRIQDFGKV